jgi:hypothetical protein
MSDEQKALRKAVTTEPLHEALHSIIYELRESIFPALEAIRILKDTELDTKKREELLVFAEAYLNRAATATNVPMVILLQRLRGDLRENTSSSEQG